MLFQMLIPSEMLPVLANLAYVPFNKKFMTRADQTMWISQGIVSETGLNEPYLGRRLKESLEPHRNNWKVVYVFSMARGSLFTNTQVVCVLLVTSHLWFPKTALSQAGSLKSEISQGKCWGFVEGVCVRSLGPSFQAVSAIKMLWSWKNNFLSQGMHACLCVLVAQPCLTLCVSVDSQAPLSMGFPPVKKSLWQTRCETANNIRIVYELWSWVFVGNYSDTLRL